MNFIIDWNWHITPFDSNPCFGGAFNFVDRFNQVIYFLAAIKFVENMCSLCFDIQI